VPTDCPRLFLGVFYKFAPHYPLWARITIALATIAEGLLSLLAAPFGYGAWCGVAALVWWAERKRPKWLAKQGRF
jgi:hypothetical protein